MTRRFTPMRSDMSQGGDCCWAFATAVYSRTSDRSGMRRLWYSLPAEQLGPRPLGEQLAGGGAR